MRLTVFGATGGIGTQVVRQAREAGHEVTAVVRDPGRLAVPGGAGLDVIRADVMDPAAITPAVQGADAVVSALGPRGTGPTTVHTDGVGSILRAMEKAGVRRLVAVSASGAFADDGDGTVTRLVVKPILQRLLRNAFVDVRRMEELIRASGTDWTIMRPPRLTNGPRRSYRTAVDGHVGFTISRADVADAILTALATPSTIGHHLGVGY